MSPQVAKTSDSQPAGAGGKRSVHVLHVVPMLGAGGMELAMSRVVNGLAGLRMRHSVVCLKGDAAIRDRFGADVAINCMHAGVNELRLPWRLWRLIRRLRPDVIHARNWSAWPDVALATLLTWPRVPLIFSFHGLDTVGPMPRRRRWASRVLAMMTARIFTVSALSRRMLIEEVGFPASRVEVIPNGVDTDHFAPGQNRTSDGRLIIGTVGNLTPVKNHALLIRAGALLVADGLDIELRIAGEGRERSRLARLAESLHVADRFHLAGHVEDIPSFLRELDVFVLPSDSEAHPNALLEAMACALPCVATRVGGVPEVLDDGRYGLLAEPGDPNSVARAMGRLSGDPSLRRALGQAARERVADRYSMKGMLTAYRTLYERPRQRGAATGGFAFKSEKVVKPRVLMLGPLPPLTGGMATVVDNLRSSDLASQCRLTILNNGKTTPQGRSLPEAVAAQVKLLGRLVRRVRSSCARIVHLHTCSDFTFWRDCVHMVVARLLGCRVVWHIHGGGFDEFAARQRWVCRGFLRAALTHASAVIVLSPKWRHTLLAHAPRARWRVVANGVRMPSSTANVQKGAPSFLFLGDLSKRKGASDLLEAADHICQRGFQGDISLAGGETAPGQKRALERRIAASGLDRCVRLLGIVSGQDKENALARADCFVLPSYAEGLPMAMLEAMAYGLPVIATRVGAISEVITDGREGFLIQPGDVKALADRMSRLASDSDLRKRMGQAARRLVRAEYSLDVAVGKIRDVYRDVMCQGKRY